MLRPAHSALYLLCFQERKEKNSLFPPPVFTPTNSPIILFLPYQWRKGNTCHSCSGLAEDKTSVLLCLTITSCSAQRPIFLLLQIFLERHKPQEIFTGVKGDQVVNLLLLPQCCHGTHRPYLIRVTELLPCFIKGPQSDFCGYSHRICLEKWL